MASTTADDPFRHHPRLRDLIRDPSESAFRGFDIEEVAARRPELGLEDFILPRGIREAGRRQALDARPEDDLWVFAYGSLMWDPGFLFTEVRRARVETHARRFILRDVFGARGTRENPGLMAALDTGPGCDGLAFRIPSALVEAESRHIWNRERAGPAYHEAFVTARLSDAEVPALAFVADHGSDVIRPGLTREEQLQYLVHGTGFQGSSMEYIENLARHFDTLGIEDAEVSALLAEAKNLAAALASRGQ